MIEKIDAYNKSLFNLLVLFSQKNLKEAAEPITFRGPWQREDDIMGCITNYCGRNMAMLYDIVDHLDN